MAMQNLLDMHQVKILRNNERVLFHARIVHIFFGISYSGFAKSGDQLWQCWVKNQRFRDVLGVSVMTTSTLMMETGDV
jgi:hypothetical protein